MDTIMSSYFSELKVQFPHRALAVALCLASGAPALAQQTPQEAADQGLQEIIVTAERRSSSIQRSSLAIQAIGGDEIAAAGVARAADIATLVPGLQIATLGTQTNVYLRGIGQNAGNSLATNAVAFNIDGVYVARPTAINSEFYDLSRIEVVKGPQGTLYGRNASGGAVNLISNRPTDTLGAKASAEIGNYNAIRTEASVNIPLSSTLAMRVAGQLVRHDGYLTDGTDNQKSEAGRLMVKWDPSEKVDFLFKLVGSHEGGRGGGSTFLPRQPGWSRWIGASSPEVNAIVATQPVGGVFPRIALGTDSFVDNDLWNVGLEANVDLGFATLTVLPAYRSQNLSYRTYNFGIRGDVDETSRQTSFEARLGQSYGQTSWVLGAYYFLEKQKILNQVNQGYIAQTFDINYRTKSYAVFGQATVAITDRLRGIGGLRYTNETQKQGGTGEAQSPFPFFVTPPYDLDARRKGKAVNWKAGFEFDVAPRSMLFATASTGFKSGGLDVAPPRSYNPEKLTAFEAGIKNRLFDNKLQLNLEGFYWIYKDHQDQYLTTINGQFSLITLNADRTELYGANVDIAFQPSNADTLRLNIEYLHSQYTDFTYVTAGPFDPRLTTCAPIAQGGGLVTLDCSGKQLARAPKWSGSASYEHIFVLNSGGSIIAGADLRFASARWLDQNFTQPNGRAAGYAVTGLNLTYVLPGERASVGAYVRNLTNTAVYTGALQTGIVNNIFAQIAPPRTYGIRASVEF